MSDPTSRGELPPEEDPGDLAGYDAMSHIEGEDVLDISDSSGPELTTGVADIDSGAAGGRKTAARGGVPSAGPDGSRSDQAVVRGTDAGTETPPRAVPDDEP